MSSNSIAMRERKVSEHDEQVAVVDWMFAHVREYPELDLAFAPPNGAMMGGGKLGAIRANSLKAEGMRPGVSDLVIPSPRGGYFGLFLEMKARTGKLSENQEQFLAGVERYGYQTFVAYGADEAIEFLESYLKQPYTNSVNMAMLINTKESQ